MKKTIILSAVVALAMVSCTKEGTDEERGEQAAIVLGSRVSNIDTRGAINDDFTTFDAGIVAYTGSATVSLPTFTLDPITFTRGESTTVTGRYYPSNGNTVTFVGYAPAGASISGANATFTINGGQDVMYAPPVGGTKNSTKPNLAFAHKLTLLRFLIKAEDNIAIMAWGDVTKIEILNCKNEIVLDLSNGSATASGVAAFTSFTGTQELTATLAGAGDEVMIYPMAVGTLNLMVYTTLCPEGQTVNLSSQPFVAGSAYNINLTFKATIIEPTASVTEWLTEVTPDLILN